MIDSQPVFLFPRNSVSKKALSTLLDRLDFYGKCWSENHSTKIVVHLQRNRSLEELLWAKSYENLKVISLTRSSLLNIISPLFLKRFTKANNIKVVFICGDLFIAPLMAKIAKLRICSNCRIQISLHGDPTGSDPVFIGLIKKFLLRRSIDIADSIRLVSTHVGDEILRNRDRLGKSIFVAPIPTELPVHSRSWSGKTILAFIGRLQNERNPQAWCELAIRFLNEIPASQAIVIGGGPLRRTMENAFQSPISERIEFIGEVEKEKLNPYWPSISILLSTAESEGFGLSIREALTRGVYVVAKENTGTLRIAAEFHGIFTYKNLDEGFRLIQNLIGKSFDESDRILNVGRVLAENQSSMRNLMKSWDLVD